MNDSDEVVEVLEDIRRWVKLIGLEDARANLREAIAADDDQKEKDNRIIFHLTNGERSTKDIEKFVNVTYKTVSDRQQEWAKAGLMEKPARNQPYRKLITLEEAGLGKPDIEKVEEDE